MIYQKLCIMFILLSGTLGGLNGFISGFGFTGKIFECLMGFIFWTATAIMFIIIMGLSLSGLAFIINT